MREEEPARRRRAGDDGTCGGFRRCVREWRNNNLGTRLLFWSERALWLLGTSWEHSIPTDKSEWNVSRGSQEMHLYN